MKFMTLVFFIAVCILPWNNAEAVNYICAKDVNGDEVIDTDNEWFSCISTAEGNLCPADITSCNIGNETKSGSGSECADQQLEAYIFTEDDSTYYFMLFDYSPHRGAHKNCGGPGDGPMGGHIVLKLENVSDPVKFCINASGDGCDTRSVCLVKDKTMKSAASMKVTECSAGGSQTINYSYTISYKSHTCPLGEQYACMDNNGSFQCSSSQCIDFDVVEKITQEPDTSQYYDDGDVAADGTCLGDMLLMNGEPRTCRKAGMSTFFTNCCGSAAKDGSGSIPLPLIMSGKCTEDEMLTYYDNIQGGKCHSVGKYCSSLWTLPFLGCTNWSESMCCFSSKLARIMHEQGRPQLKRFGPDGGWGGALTPNCDAFTPEEFQMIDFGQVDFGQYFDEDIKDKIIGPIKDKMRDTIDGFTDNIR